MSFLLCGQLTFHGVDSLAFLLLASLHFFLFLCVHTQTSKLIEFASFFISFFATPAVAGNFISSRYIQLHLSLSLTNLNRIYLFGRFAFYFDTKTTFCLFAFKTEELFPKSFSRAHLFVSEWFFILFCFRLKKLLHFNSDLDMSLSVQLLFFPISIVHTIASAIKIQAVHLLCVPKKRN